MKNQWKKAKKPASSEIERSLVPIVSDAAISSIGVADGRMLPLVIIDTSFRSDIEDAIKAHVKLGPGDVDSVWVKPSSKDKDRIGLLLELKKLSSCTILLSFNISRNAGLVDLIVHSQGLYLQAGRMGNRLKSTMDKERILVEVPSKNFQDEWNKMLHYVIERDFRKSGASRHEAKKMCEEFIVTMRKLGSLRMKDE
jgi:hypothetical protein